MAVRVLVKTHLGEERGEEIAARLQPEVAGSDLGSPRCQAKELDGRILEFTHVVGAIRGGEQASAGGEHALDLSQRRVEIGHVIEDVVRDDNVERAVVERCLRQVAADGTRAGDDLARCGHHAR